MATYSSILAWKIPWTEECGRLTVHGVTKSQTQLSDFTLLRLLSSLRENIFFVLCVLVLLANPSAGFSSSYFWDMAGPGLWSVGDLGSQPKKGRRRENGTTLYCFFSSVPGFAQSKWPMIDSRNE